MCSLQAVFLLVLLGELLALALTLADSTLTHFDWEGLGLRSVLIQWVMLLSAALLCRLRPWLAKQLAWQAGVVSYVVVLLVTAACSAVAVWSMLGRMGTWVLLDNLLLAAIIGGIILRYLYLQQQLHNQQQAELQARLQALQSRIQPHFLFNSMNSIASLIAVDPDKAERMVEDLSALFRASLAEPGLVPLKDELALCRQYAAIEQIRLGERLQVDWQIDTALDLEHWPIPSLLLQPLLENAVVHGIQPLVKGGVVKIAMAARGEGVAIEVSNPVSEFYQRDVSIAGPGNTRGNQLALPNIAHRLQAHFGPQASIECSLVSDCYTAKVFYPLSMEHRHRELVS